MICPKCGTTNGESNRFCRECGGRLDAPETPHPASADELALGEELFKVWQLLEADELDAALEKSLRISHENPESATAHSLAALVYERRSDSEFAAGDAVRAEQFLKLSIHHYEKIVDLNPDSSADREKLAALRIKLADRRTPSIKGPFAFREALRAVPAPALLAGAAFLVALVLLIIFVPGSRKSDAVVSAQEPGSAVNPVQALGNSSPPKQPPAGLKVYTFRPTTPNAPAADDPEPPSATNAEPPRAQPRSPSVKPAKLPALPPELTLVPEPKSADTAKKPATPAPTKPKVAPVDAGPTGRTVFAEAIRLGHAGRTQEAIGAAEQAIALYQADIEAGRDVEAANRGIDNAKKQIRVWQQSIVLSVEQ